LFFAAAAASRDIPNVSSHADQRSHSHRGISDKALISLKLLGFGEIDLKAQPDLDPVPRFRKNALILEA
jgi:hypothetical protein